MRDPAQCLWKKGLGALMLTGSVTSCDAANTAPKRLVHVKTCFLK
jgi:hypothetical protein